MSGPLSVVNGNPPQGLSAAQLEQLNAIASMAKGSGLFEGANGGKGIMGSFVDSVTGQTHYIKMLTHKGERDKAFAGRTEAEVLNSQEEDGALLGAMSTSLNKELAALAEQVGVKGEFEALLKSRKDGFSTLMSRSIVAQAVSLIGKAHNNATGANGVRFNWKTVAHAGTDKTTTLNMVLQAAKNITQMGETGKGAQHVLTVGEDMQAKMSKLMKDPPSSEEATAKARTLFVEQLQKGIAPNELMKVAGLKLSEFDATMRNGTGLSQFHKEAVCAILADQVKNGCALDQRSLEDLWDKASNVVTKVLKTLSAMPTDKKELKNRCRNEFAVAFWHELSGELDAQQQGKKDAEAKKDAALSAARQLMGNLGIATTKEKDGSQLSLAELKAALNNYLTKQKGNPVSYAAYKRSPAKKNFTSANEEVSKAMSAESLSSMLKKKIDSNKLVLQAVEAGLGSFKSDALKKILAKFSSETASLFDVTELENSVALTSLANKLAIHFSSRELKLPTNGVELENSYKEFALNISEMLSNQRLAIPPKAAAFAANMAFAAIASRGIAFGGALGQKGFAATLEATVRSHGLDTKPYMKEIVGAAKAVNERLVARFERQLAQQAAP